MLLKTIYRTCQRIYQKRFKHTASEAIICIDEPYKLHNLNESPAMKVKVTREEALKYYKDMFYIRKIEDTAKKMHAEKIIIGPCHLYAGQEACAVGTEAAIRHTDIVITNYRIHGWTYTRGISVKQILAELAGRRTGCSQGKGGSMHMYSDNFYGGWGVVGAQVPIGTGISFSMKYKGTDDICITVYGDGAANQGQVFESYNMAKLWNLPCVFVCENNKISKGTLTENTSANIDMYTRSEYIPGIWINGQDVLMVREGMKYAADYVRSGKGPLVVELSTHRFHGHHLDDADQIRTDDEIETLLETKDPISNFLIKIITSRLVSSDEIQAIEENIVKDIYMNLREALEDRVMELSGIYKHVYSNPPKDFIPRPTTIEFPAENRPFKRASAIMTS